MKIAIIGHMPTEDIRDLMINKLSLDVDKDIILISPDEAKSEVSELADLLPRYSDLKECVLQAIPIIEPYFPSDNKNFINGKTLNKKKRK